MDGENIVCISINYTIVYVVLYLWFEGDASPAHHINYNRNSLICNIIAAYISKNRK